MYCNATLARRTLSAGLALTLLLGPLTGLTAPVLAAPATAKAVPGSAPSILLFPFDNNAGASADDIAARVTDAVQLRLSSVAAYKVTLYNRFLPPIQRAAQETPPVLSSDDVKAPFDPQKADRIAAQVSTDDYLIGAVETFTSDPNTRRVSVTVSADLRSTVGGSSLRTLAYTGTAAPSSISEPLDSVTQRAIDSVASKVVATINAGRPTQAVVLNSARGHSTAGQTFLLAVLASTLIYAIAHNSSKSENGGASTGSISTGPASGSTSSGTSPSGPPAPP